VTHHESAAPVRPRRGLAAGAAAVAVSACGGAVGLVTGALSLTHTYEQRLPFRSPVFGGIALGLVVGVPFMLLAVLAHRGDPHTERVSLGVGVLLIGWLLVELAFIRTFSFFHPFFGAIGVVFIASGRRAWPLWS
jgi:hypothetical protein